MNSARPHVALLVDQLGGGGAQRSATLTATALHHLGHRATVLTARGGGSYASELPADLNVQILAPSWPSPRGVVIFLVRLRRAVLRHHVDVILTNGFTVGRLALVARSLGRLRGLSVIVVERSTLSVALADRFPNRLMRSPVRVLTRWLYRRADAIIGVSDGVSRDIEATLRLPAGSVRTIHNPVDTERITAAMTEPVPEALSHSFESLRRPVIITTGRLVTAKAHRDLLDAFALLPQPTRGSLVILGEGPLRGELEQQAQRLGIAEDVWMPGFVENPWWFMARSDLFAFSSHWEGHPRVLLEALACGIPVVSTDCPSGPREILTDEPNARLTPVGDPNALAHAIDELLSSPFEAESDINLERYKPSHVATRYAEVACEANHQRQRRTRR